MQRFKATPEEEALILFSPDSPLAAIPMAAAPGMGDRIVVKEAFNELQPGMQGTVTETDQEGWISVDLDHREDPEWVSVEDFHRIEILSGAEVGGPTTQC